MKQAPKSHKSYTFRVPDPIVMMLLLDCCDVDDDDGGDDCDDDGRGGCDDDGGDDCDDGGVRDCFGTILLFRWRSRLRGGGFVSRRDTNPRHLCHQHHQFFYPRAIFLVLF